MRILPKTVVEPATEPVTLAQLRAQIRADDTSDDALLWSHLIAARQHIEDIMGRPIVPRTVRAVIESWPSGCRGDTVIELMIPVNSIDAISYTDDAQAVTPWTGFVARTGQGGVTTIRPAYSNSWPTLGYDPLITIDATAGFADGVPEPVAAAVCLFAAHLYMNREATVAGPGGMLELPLGVKAMLSKYRWRWIG